MYNYGARYYDPGIGVFLGVDPLADKFSGWNPYNYTMNNPINMIDPDGRSPEWIPDGVGGWIAEFGDSAWSLSKDANIPAARANQLVVNQLRPNYTRQSDGMLMSDVEIGDRVMVGVRPVISHNRLSISNNNVDSGNSISSPTVLGVGSDVVGGLGAGFSTVGRNFSLTNSKGVAPKFYSNKFYGNQYGSVTSSSKIGTSLGRAGSFVTVGYGAYDIGTNYMQVGGVGMGTSQAIGRTPGSLLGGSLGAKVCGGIGFCFGGPPGAIGGGILGGVIFGYGGSVVGEKAATEVYKSVNE